MSFRKVLAAMVYRERCETAEKHDFQRSLNTKLPRNVLKHYGFKTFISVLKISILFSYEKVLPLKVSGAVEGQFDGQSMCGIVAGSTQIY